MARLGMDVDLVEQAGKALKQQAATLTSISGGLDKLVNNLLSVWEGPDAQKFVHQWWPEQRKQLGAVTGYIDGLGQSALNNASEQRNVSGASSGGASAAASLGAAGLAAAAATAAAPGSANPGEGAAFTSWANGAVGRGIDVDHAYGNQCVDVINDYADTVFPGVPHSVSLGGGNADQIYGNANPQYFDKISSHGSPQPGDILCIGPNQYSSVGHVAVVESVQNGVVHVIQQNGANPGGVTYRGTISSVEMAAAQGYLRPKAV